MPKAFPLEFRRDVVAVARKGEAPIARIAKDFGISESCLQRWLKLADIEDGNRPGVTQADAAELREAKSESGCWNRRMKSCAGRPRICRRRRSHTDSSMGSVKP